MLLFVRGNSRTRGNIWKLVWRVCNPAVPEGPRGILVPIPSYYIPGVSFNNMSNSLRYLCGRRHTCEAELPAINGTVRAYMLWSNHCACNVPYVQLCWWRAARQSAAHPSVATASNPSHCPSPSPHLQRKKSFCRTNSGRGWCPTAPRKTVWRCYQTVAAASLRPVKPQPRELHDLDMTGVCQPMI